MKEYTTIIAAAEDRIWLGLPGGAAQKQRANAMLDALRDYAEFDREKAAECAAELTRILES